jgi:hypothetical protein
MLFNKLKPENVFTPRASEVNADMYVERPELENALLRAMRGNMHMIIHGESGAGKSWLYKESFKKNKVKFLVANLANASRMGSITAELKNLVDREEKPRKTSFEETKAANLNAGIAEGSISHAGQYEIGTMEPFELCLAYLRKEADDAQSVLVFDNLEAAFNDDLLKELANLVILCDDDRYSKYKIKIMIVGVPTGIKEYYYRTPHLTTVANRLYELPEVSRLSKSECELLVRRGFSEKLKYQVEDIEYLVSHVAWITDRLPQMVHEYCLELAYLAEGDKSVDKDRIELADTLWMQSSLFHAYVVAESHMNERDTKAGRKNQTLYSMSIYEGEQFKAADIESILRREFPTSSRYTALNIPQMLGQLSSGKNPIIKKSPKGDAFRFYDPRYRMVLRSMLRKTSDERIEKIPISSV